MDVNEVNKALAGFMLKAGRKFDTSLYSASKGAGAKGESELRDAARKFEGLFISHLMNEMFKTTGGSFLGKGSEGDIIQGLFVQKISESLSEGKGIGLAEMIYKFLERNEAPTPTNFEWSDK